MKKSLLPLTFAVIVAASSAAFAGHSIGQIQSIDHTANAVTLMDGTTYSFVRSDNDNPLNGLRPGNTVDILWLQNGNARVGKSLSPMSGDYATGTIQSLDPVAATVTLNDGRIFHFAQSSETNATLGAVRPGDVVSVAYHEASGTLRGDALGTVGGDHVTGTIASITGDTVTLKDGSSYVFSDRHSMRQSLATLKAGDRVDILWAPSGQLRMGNAISPVNG
ncbi:hypothetical protein RGUI_0480 [Rhodovulum sp. P5]|uniref:DUF1344 domain-containing protein n=1 Tax=Rhodovulum sp. P5 TaxID=1564506 RepID=UPI0009C23E7E|nr:DUF1344 domain-containing protein [Rhodovulum sp. P5]ARE38621.1 hypothetical protein RGUI_0480 [Rhodovulum sp. P5]